LTKEGECNINDITNDGLTLAYPPRNVMQGYKVVRACRYVTAL